MRNTITMLSICVCLVASAQENLRKKGNDKLTAGIVFATAGTSFITGGLFYRYLSPLQTNKDAVGYKRSESEYKSNQGVLFGCGAVFSVAGALLIGFGTNDIRLSKKSTLKIESSGTGLSSTITF